MKKRQVDEIDIWMGTFFARSRVLLLVNCGTFLIAGLQNVWRLLCQNINEVVICSPMGK